MLTEFNGGHALLSERGAGMEGNKLYQGTPARLNPSHAVPLVKVFELVKHPTLVGQMAQHEHPLNPRLDLYTASRRGFWWGGQFGAALDGAKQLAFALCLDALSGYKVPTDRPGAATAEQLAAMVHEHFQWRILSVIHTDSGWFMSQSIILGQIQAIINELVAEAKTAAARADEATKALASPAPEAG